MITRKTKPQCYVFHDKYGEGTLIGFLDKSIIGKYDKNTAIVKFKNTQKYINPKELQLIERIEYSSILDIDFRKLFTKCAPRDEIKLLIYNKIAKKDEEIIFFYEYSPESYRYTLFEKTGFFRFTRMSGFSSIESMGHTLNRKIKDFFESQQRNS